MAPNDLVTKILRKTVLTCGGRPTLARGRRSEAHRSSRETLMDQRLETIRQETLIEADPATIFAYLTDADRLTRWMGVSATLDPRPGGIYLVEVGSGNMARGEFREVVPVSRLAYSWGWEKGPNLPPGASLVEIDLIPRNGSTLLRMTHSGVPAALAPSHRLGWAHYVARLALAAGGRDPGPNRGPKPSSPPSARPRLERRPRPQRRTRRAARSRRRRPARRRPKKQRARLRPRSARPGGPPRKSASLGGGPPADRSASSADQLVAAAGFAGLRTDYAASLLCAPSNAGATSRMKRSISSFTWVCGLSPTLT